MTQRYRVSYNGRPLALAFVSPHSEYAGHIIVSVVPLTRKGKWVDSTASITFEDPLSDIFVESMPEEQAVLETIAQAAIEPWKIELFKVDAWL